MQCPKNSSISKVLEQPVDFFNKLTQFTKEIGVMEIYTMTPGW